MKALPEWFCDLVAAIDKYEEEHGEGMPCLKKMVALVPDDVRAYCRGWQAGRERGA